MNVRIEQEKNKYNKLYTDLVFACDDLRLILNEEELNKRSFILKVDTLKNYIAFLDKLERDSREPKGLFSKIFNKDEDIDSKINKYLTRDTLSNLEKLEKCTLCKCKNCVTQCPMNQCYNCREKEYVSGCNKVDTTLTTSSESITLYDGNDEIVFNVVAYLVEKDTDGRFKRYVYLVDSKNYDNQHLLRYSKFKGEEMYDSVITDNNQDELVRLNDKFIEMGLRV